MYEEFKNSLDKWVDEVVNDPSKLDKEYGKIVASYIARYGDCRGHVAVDIVMHMLFRYLQESNNILAEIHLLKGVITYLISMYEKMRSSDANAEALRHKILHALYLVLANLELTEHTVSQVSEGEKAI